MYYQVSISLDLSIKETETTVMLPVSSFIAVGTATDTFFERQNAAVHFFIPALMFFAVLPPVYVQPVRKTANKMGKIYFINGIAVLKLAKISQVTGLIKTNVYCCKRLQFFVFISSCPMIFITPPE